MQDGRGTIARWRHEESVRRTAARRPDLRHPGTVAPESGWEVVPATRGDAGELLTLQRACWLQEALALDVLRGIPPLEETLEDVVAGLTGRGDWQTWVVRRAGRLVGSVRGRRHDDVWHVGRLMVAPDLQGQGLGRVLLEHAQAVAPDGVTSFELFTGHASRDNQRMYRKAGFRLRPDIEGPPLTVVLTKRRR